MKTYEASGIIDAKFIKDKGAIDSTEKNAWVDLALMYFKNNAKRSESFMYTNNSVQIEYPEYMGTAYMGWRFLGLKITYTIEGE